MATKLKPLPIGIQTFEKIIEGGYTYVDKTKELYDLVSEGEVYFLSRPRRFGKSLLVSTLEALFQNRRELFKGLWIDSSDYKWEKYPVIKISMPAVDQSMSIEDLNLALQERLSEIANDYKINIENRRASLMLRDLIVKLEAQYDKVVVLIDEYDKPILDNISNPARVESIRDFLRTFYSELKENDAKLRFILLTGVSRFSKVSIFSGLNNLEDISMSPEFASICGYTQEDLEINFKEYIDLYAEFNSGYKFNNRDELLVTIKEWYNGYRFTEAEIKVYNPFSTLLLFKSRQFAGHWFATGTPKFLIDIIESQKYYDVDQFENIEVGTDSLAKFDINSFDIPSIMYQTGYTTIKEVKEGGLVLSYPNKEVRKAFIEELSDRFSKMKHEERYSYVNKLIESLRSTQLNQFINILKSYFTEIPYDIQIPLEKYYQSMIYLICRMVSERVKAEVRTNKGRIDMVIELPTETWIIEFKINASADSALAQIHEKKYYEKYTHLKKPIKLIGVEFSSTERNITEFKVEDYRV